MGIDSQKNSFLAEIGQDLIAEYRWSNQDQDWYFEVTDRKKNLLFKKTRSELRNEVLDQNPDYIDSVLGGFAIGMVSFTKWQTKYGRFQAPAVLWCFSEK